MHRDPSVDEYAAIIRRHLSSIVERGSETVSIADALARVTAEDVLSPVDLPLFRNSQMDGFAVLAANLVDLPVRLPIVGEIAARPGRPAAFVAGTAVRIMTGGVMPDDADAVVPVEDTETEDTETEDTETIGSTVTIRRPRSSGEYVRERGSDLRAGDRLLPAELLLASRHLAALAAAGINRVAVTTRVRVAVITTGAELVVAGSTPTIGQVFDANSVALVAAIKSCGASVVAAHRVTDDHDAMRAALTDAATHAELVLTSGGISMGAYEVVREVLEPIGGVIGHIAMQPGGPQATAVIDGVPVISFPGNPVSTQISFEVFVAPLLREIAGLPAAVRQRRTVSSDVQSIAGKRQFLRGRALGDDGVEVVGGPSSHLVAGLAASDLLVDIPAETTELTKGDTVETLAL